MQKHGKITRIVLAIVAVFIPLLGTLMGQLFMSSGIPTIMGGIVGIIWMILVWMCVYPYWKDSTFVRGIVISILCVVPSLFIWYLCVLTEDVSMLFLGSPICVAIIVGVLPGRNATVWECCLLALQFLGAYIPLFLSAFLIFPLMCMLAPITLYFDPVIFEIFLLLSPLLILLIGLCVTLYLLFRMHNTSTSF